MNLLNVAIETDLTVATLTRDYQRSVSAKYATVQNLAVLLEKVLSGNVKGSPPTVTVTAYAPDNYASGTFTLDTVVATDAVSINGVSFTAVASGATGNQFNVGADDDETATNLAAAINASVTALVDNYVTASATGAVVTVTSAFPGLAGNQTLIASADATITASGARLTGGDLDTDAKVYTF